MIFLVLLRMQLEGLDVKYSVDADDRIREECCPDKPHIVYRNEPTVDIYLRNPQPCNATFGLTVPIYANDTAQRVKTRIVRNEKLIKGDKTIPAGRKYTKLPELIELAELQERDTRLNP